MVIQDKMANDDIAAVIRGYSAQYMIYVDYYKDGGKLTELLKGIRGIFV